MTLDKYGAKFRADSCTFCSEVLQKQPEGFQQSLAERRDCQDRKRLTVKKRSRSLKNLPDVPQSQSVQVALLPPSPPPPGRSPPYVTPPAAAEVMYSFHVRRKRNILFQLNALMQQKAGRSPGRALSGATSASETKATGSPR